MRMQNIPLRKKFYAILLVCILMISSMAFISITIVSSSYQKQLYQSMAASLSYSTAEIYSQLENINTMADLFLADSNVQSDLSDLKDSSNTAVQTAAYQDLYSTLNDYFYNFQRNHIRYMELFQNQFSIRTTTLKNQSVPPALRQPLIERAVERGGASCWVTEYGNEQGLFLVRQLRRAKLTRLDHLGVLVANVDLNAMIDSCTAYSDQYENLSCMLFENDSLIFVSDSLDSGAAASVNRQLAGSYSVVSVDGRQYFAVRGQIPDFDWDYICMIPYASIGRSLQIAKNTCFGVICASILLSFGLCSRMIRSITRHLDHLVWKMKAFGERRPIPAYDGCDYENRADELGILHTQFDSMVREIENLIQSNYVNEILKKEAELKALEYQINPHFLYNTLESVNWRAKAIGETDISAMVESLGRLLRITLDKKQGCVTLEQELELIRAYMTIQKIRFEERLDYTIMVSPSYNKVPIPKLTIQPLVENAIQYGLEQTTEECVILITAELTGTLFSLYVKNNGSQFEDHLLERLQTAEILPNGLGIGLLNIDKRLKLTFGPEYGLSLYNEGELAVARISIPFQESEDHNAEADHCG